MDAMTEGGNTPSSIDLGASIPAGIDLLLVMCPPWDVDLPPLNLAYLLAAVRRAGHSAGVIDLNNLFYRHSRQRRSMEIWQMSNIGHISAGEIATTFFTQASEIVEQFLKSLERIKPRCIGFSIHCHNTEVTERLVFKIRALLPETRIIYGGPQVTEFFIGGGKLASLRADAYVVGEGEETLVDALEALGAEAWGRPVDGMLYSDQLDRASFRPRSLGRDLDLLPFPAFEDFNRHRYGKPFMLPFHLSRGCVCRCSFCSDTVYSAKFRIRTPGNAVEELEKRVLDLDVWQFRFNDLLCNGDVKKLMAFCDRLIERRLNIVWHSYAIIRRSMTAEVFRKLKQAGCMELIFGLESGSDHVLRLMNKNYHAAAAGEVLRRCAGEGINTSVNIIVGCPGELEEHHQETMRFLVEHQQQILAIVNLSTFSLAPGTPFATSPESFGIEFTDDGNWFVGAENTPEIRARRLQEIGDLAENLGRSPCITNNLDGGGKLAVAERGHEILGPEGSTCGDRFQLGDIWPEAASTLYTEHVRSLPQEARVILPAEMVLLNITYQARARVDNPLFRVQFFAIDDAYKDLFLFGTNTYRCALGPICLNPGQGHLGLLIYRLNLGPGKYGVTVGVWPDEGECEPLDVRHTCLVLRVKSHEENQGPLVFINHHWVFVADPQALAGDSEAGAKEGPASAGVQVTDQRGATSVFIKTQDRLILQIQCQNPVPGEVQVTARIKLRGRVIHSTTFPGRPPYGPFALELYYNPIGLLEEMYTIEVVLVAAGEELARGELTCAISSNRFEGAGIVFCPVTWFRRGA